MGFAKLAKYLDSLYDEKNVPGVGFAMYHRHKPVFEHYAGFADVDGGVPFGPDTVFNLYSATKLLTCAAALALVEEGRLALDDPLSAYIPEYKDMLVQGSQASNSGYAGSGGDADSGGGAGSGGGANSGGATLHPARKAITILHLFTMAAGIEGSRDAKCVQQVVRETGGKAPTLAVARARAKAPLHFEPGTRFEYGVCHDVLGAVIEVVTGKTLGAYMKERIFDRIGMRDTTFTPTAEQLRRRARLYVGFDSKTGRAESEGETIIVRLGEAYESGGGGLVSTVPDYILFAEAMCNGGVAPNGERILKRETIDLIRRNRMDARQLADFEKMGGWSKMGYGYGLGARVLMDRERNNALSENGEFGWDGARGCYAVIDPAAEIALFYAQQEGKWPWWTWHGTVRNMAYASVWE